VVSKPPLEPNLCVGEKRLILEIANYSSGLNLQPALILGRLKILKPLPVSFPPEPEKRAIHKAGDRRFLLCRQKNGCRPS
jgi:hypothetical protein